MALFSLLNLARDGIIANSAALNVTGQNIAGASTPGFVRRTADMQSRSTGGVDMVGARRGFDRFSYDQLISQESKLAAASSRANTLVTVEATVAPGTSSLNQRAAELFSSMQEMAMSPNDMGVRAAVLSRAASLADGFAETSDGLANLRSDLFSQSRDVISEVNDRLKRLEDIETQLTAADARGEDTADIRDTRDQLVRDVATRIGARAIENADGRITLFSGGVVLLEGGKAARLTVGVDPQGMIKVQADRNGSLIDVTSTVQSGKLAGVIQARDQDVPSVVSQLDTFAKDLSDMLNTMHAAGFGLDGGTGRPLFEPLTSATGAAHGLHLDPGLVGHPERLAAAGSLAELPGGNSNAVLLAAANVAKLAGGDTVSERYASITSRVGIARSSAAAEETMRLDTVASASSLRESASGVSTDEEMVRLQQFQRAFEASTRVLKTVETLFDSLMAVVG